MVVSSRNVAKNVNWLVICFISLKQYIQLCYGSLVIVITGRHIRAARALLGLAQTDLARKSKAELGTVRRMEESNGAVTARTDTLGRVVAALEKEGGGVPERAPCGSG